MVLLVTGVPEAPKAIQAIAITFGCLPQVDCAILLPEVEEMAQWLRKVITLAEHPISIPSIHTAAQNHLYF